MTSTDYLINFALIALVFLQIRDRPLTARTLLRPVLLVAAAALYYLKGVPASGHDVLLYVVLGTVGVVLGVACATTTRVWRAEDGVAHTKAGVVAAIFWVLGIGSRLAFEEYSSHGGEKSIAHFSVVHQISSSNAWVAGLVIMALAEVLSRLGVLWLRGSRLSTHSTFVTSSTVSSPVGS